MSKCTLSSLGRLMPLVAILGIVAGTALAGGIVDHPDKLKFNELKFEPPKPGDFRHTLKCGAPIYITENHEVPTFELTILVRTGSMYEPVAKAGLSEMAAYAMRNGGTGEMSAKDLDERLAYLAGTISVHIRDSQGQVRLFCLSKDMDEGLATLKGILRTPGFDQDAIDRHCADVLSELEQRNSSTAAIESREWAFLLYGDHPCTRAERRTAESIHAITRADLVAFHETYFFPKNFILAVSGDFKAKDVIKKLDAMFAGWPNRELDLPAIPETIADPRPGVYMVAKEDFNQSRIRVGHIGVKRDIADQYALLLMNDILGGGGFSSRITRRVRSDEGLAYSTGSRFDRPVLYPGTFRAWFQTKHATAAFGTRLIVDEIERIRREECSEEDLRISKAGYIGQMVDPFSSRNSIVNTFANDEYTGRPKDYWRDYAKNIESVTPRDIQAVAQKYLHPDKLVFLVVGDPDAVNKGSDKHPERFSDFGEIEILPLRDPLTLEAR